MEKGTNAEETPPKVYAQANRLPATGTPQKDRQLIEVAGLWWHESKRAGNAKYLAGTNGNLRYYIVPNRHKKTDREPDYHLLIGERPPSK